jgi:hypothetical protein
VTSLLINSKNKDRSLAAYIISFLTVSLPAILAVGYTELIFKLYSFNYIILKTALSCLNSKILKYIIIFCPLILTCIRPVFKLIILFLYSTDFPKIITKV